MTDVLKSKTVSFFIIIVGIIGMMTIVGCEPDRGDKLDGKWLLKEVVRDGVVEPVDTVWYNFQNTLFMYQYYRPQQNSYHHIYALKVWEDKDHVRLEWQGDQNTIESFLPQTDWESATRVFRVDKCSGSDLTLSSEGKEYRFKKH